MTDTDARGWLGHFLLAHHICVRQLRPIDFPNEEHQLVFAALLALAADGRRIDLVGLADELRRDGLLDRVGGPVTLARLVEDARTLDL